MGPHPERARSSGWIPQFRPNTFRLTAKPESKHNFTIESTDGCVMPAVFLLQDSMISLIWGTTFSILSWRADAAVAAAIDANDAIDATPLIADAIDATGSVHQQTHTWATIAHTLWQKLLRMT